MTTEQTHILQMLAAGDITVEQAAAYLRGGRPAPGAGPTPPPGPAPAAALDTQSLAGRWLRVRVTDLDSGRPRVNVNLPLSWVAVGLKIGAQYSPEINNLDLAQIIADVQAGTAGRIVDVEDLEDGERVEIFIE